MVALNGECRLRMMKLREANAGASGPVVEPTLFAAKARLEKIAILP